MIRRNIDGKCTMSDEELVALVKNAYKRTAKICSRGVRDFTVTAPGPWYEGIGFVPAEHYASASGAMCLAFGEDVFDQLGFSQAWQSGFVGGFEWKYTERHIVPHFNDPYHWPHGNDPDFRIGFEKGKMVAAAVFSWPESPKVGDKPQK